MEKSTQGQRLTCFCIGSSPYFSKNGRYKTKVDGNLTETSAVCQQYILGIMSPELPPHNRPAINKPPHIGGETAECLLDLEKPPGVIDCGKYFLPTFVLLLNQPRNNRDQVLELLGAMHGAKGEAQELKGCRVFSIFMEPLTIRLEKSAEKR